MTCGSIYGFLSTAHLRHSRARRSLAVQEEQSLPAVCLVRLRIARLGTRPLKLSHDVAGSNGARLNDSRVDAAQMQLNVIAQISQRRPK